MVSQFIEVAVLESIQRLRSLIGVEDKQFSNKVDSFFGSSLAEDPVPRKGLDLRESVLLVLGIHRKDLMSLWGSQNFDYLYKLINSRLSREDGLAQHELSNDTTHGPNINLCCVLTVSEDKFWGPVISRANIRNVGFIGNKLFGASKVAKYESVISF